MEYYAGSTKKEILLLVTICMDLKGTILIKIS